MPHDRIAEPTLETSRPSDASAPSGHLHVFERAGCRIHAWTTGEPDAPAVVLTHGLTIDHGTFDTQVPALRDAGYRVVTWDLRGHGRSRPTGERLTIARAADDLLALLDEVEVEQAVVVGQSFGGFVVQEFHRRHPERVAGLVIAGGLPLGYRPPWLLRPFIRLMPPLQRLWPERHLRSLVPPFMSKRAEVRRYVAQANGPLERGDFARGTEAATAGLLDYDPVGRIDVPVLCLMGDRDLPLTERSNRTWAARTPLATVEIVERAGHLANQENPAGFVRALLTFMEGLVHWRARSTPA